MSGGGTDTSTSSTASSNPDVNKLISQLSGGLGAAYTAGAPKTPQYSTFSPAGATTQAGWASALGSAANPDYASGVNGAIKSFGNIASGNDFGTNDPGYAALRAKAGNDALTSVNTVFNNSGRLGGGSNVQAAGEGVTNALAGLDYTNYQNDVARQQQAASALPGLFSASQQPAAAQGAVGAAQDTNQQGILSGNYDLAQRNNNQQIDWLAKLSSILNGTAGSAGTTTTNSTPSTPWWQSGLSLAGSLL